MIDGLGCDYAKCNFCIHPKIYTKFRLRDPRLIADEIEHMIKKGIGFFTFTASDTPLHHARAIADEIVKRGLKIEFTMLTRAARNAAMHKDRLVEQYRTVIRAGLRILYIGAESGNDDVLKEVLNKNITADDILHTVESIKEASRKEGQKVYIINSFIYPIPLTKAMLDTGITLEKVLQDNVKLGKLTQPDSFQIMPAILYPGTEWYNNPDKYSIIINDTYEKDMLSLETSPHSLLDRPKIDPYTIMGMRVDEWIEQYLKMENAVRELGIPTDLNDEHIVIALSCGYTSEESLRQVSKDLMLDILSGDDTKSLKMFEKVNEVSRQIAESNRLK